MFAIEKARLEIEERNRIRAEAKLPLLAVANETRHLQRESEFEQFFRTSPLRKRVEQKLLNRMRRMRGDSRWQATGLLSGGGWAFYNRTRKIMRRIWQRRDRTVGTQAT